MSSHARSSREEERRLSMRTLIIASVASAMAAIITSYFWTSGTPIAAACTPVIVALVSELLHRPSQRIAERFTTETAALPPETDALPEAAGAGAPPPREEWDPRPAREPPPRDPYLTDTDGTPEFRVYRTATTPPSLPWKRILVTAAIAFAVAAAALTLPELIAGQSLGGGDRKTTILGGGAAKKKQPAEETQTVTQPVPQETQPVPQETQPVPQATEPEKTVPKLTTPQQTTTEPPTTQPPAPTTPAPRSLTPPP